MCNITKMDYQEIINDIARISNEREREKAIISKSEELAGLLIIDNADSKPKTADYEALFYHDEGNTLLGLLGMAMTETNTQKRMTLDTFLVQKLKSLATKYWMKEIRTDVKQARADFELYYRYKSGAMEDYQYELLNAFKLPVKLSSLSKGE